MTTKYGVFAETQALNDPYIDKYKADQSTRGLPNIRVGTCKTGKNNDATFDKYKALYEGEKYLDPLRAKLQAANAIKQKGAVATVPFKPASPMKLSVPQAGDYYGTLGGKLEHQAGSAEVKPDKGAAPLQSRGMVVGASTKKGGFGFNKTTISERCGYQGVAGEYAYYNDPIHQASRQPASDAPAPQPFKPVSPPKRGGPGTVARHFAARAKGAVGEFEWQPRPCEAPAAQQAGSEGADATEAVTAAVPFRPAASPKKGPLATLSRYPEYLHDPETMRAEAAAAQRKAGRAKMSGAGWRPNGCDKSDATRSIVRMNLK